jgi:hypothetical protein
MITFIKRIKNNISFRRWKKRMLRSGQGNKKSKAGKKVSIYNSPTTHVGTYNSPNSKVGCYNGACSKGGSSNSQLGK